MSDAVESQVDRWTRVASPHFRARFDEIPNKRSRRSDLHAFIRLDEWLSGTDRIVAAAEHDEIFLCFDLADVAKLTDDQIIELARCGVRCADDGLCMWA